MFNFKKYFFRQFLIYPLIVGFITYHVLDFISVTQWKDLVDTFGIYSVVEQFTGIRISFEQGQIAYSYLVGFAYGTLAPFTRILQVGILKPLVILVQYYMCLFLFSTIAIAVIPLEVIVLAIAFVVLKSFQKKRKLA
ncbi:hypothetical protein M3602_17710 [Terribacillus saccharophilus]|nr:hypothetical protein [Terribacillus saccharophilus]